MKCSSNHKEANPPKSHILKINIWETTKEQWLAEMLAEGTWNMA
jgi:hypothetical protein